MQKGPYGIRTLAMPRSVPSAHSAAIRSSDSTLMASPRVGAGRVGRRGHGPDACRLPSVRRRGLIRLARWRGQ
jgi:hypothetical protein